METLYISGLNLNKCLVTFPPNYSEKKECPLVVGLYGGGGAAERFIDLWKDFPDKHFIFAVPEAPYPMAINSEIRYDWAMWPTGDTKLIGKATRLSETYIMAMVQYLHERLNINGVYLLGWSQGAIFSYLVGTKRHQLFKGLICLSGPGLLSPLANPFENPIDADWLPEEFIKEARNLRIFIAHGSSDEKAAYKLGVKSKETLMKHGYDVTFQNFHGGHKLPPNKLLAKIVQWIK